MRMIPGAILCMFALQGACADTSGASDTAESYASAADLGTFCDRLPRPAYSAFTLDAASDDWFEVYEVESGIFAIYEPFQWQEVISYLILGSESALLFDTGNGIGSIRAVVARLTDKPVTVINSHSHFDHIGGNHQFERILSVSTNFSLGKTSGSQTEELLLEVSPEALCRPLPDGLDPAEHRTRPYSIAGKLADGDVIDLGTRQLEVLHVPGHTDDAIALIDRDAGFLWSGDSFYEGPIWLFAPETDLVAYRSSVARLAELAPGLVAVFPAHNTPRADPALLGALDRQLERVFAGDVNPEPAGDGNVEFRFDRFSLLLREDYYRIDVE